MRYIHQPRFSFGKTSRNSHSRNSVRSSIQVEFRADSGGNVHVPVGKRSFPADDLAENISFFMEHLKGLRPSSVKGAFVRKVSISGTMTPGLSVDMV